MTSSILLITAFLSSMSGAILENFGNAMLHSSTPKMEVRGGASGSGPNYDEVFQRMDDRKWQMRGVQEKNAEEQRYRQQQQQRHRYQQSQEEGERTGRPPAR